MTSIVRSLGALICEIVGNPEGKSAYQLSKEATDFLKKRGFTPGGFPKGEGSSNPPWFKSVGGGMSKKKGGIINPPRKG